MMTLRSNQVEKDRSVGTENQYHQHKSIRRKEENEWIEERKSGELHKQAKKKTEERRRRMNEQKK